MNTQFDLEQQILDCWGICEDLDTLMEGVMDRDMTQDDIANVLIGMKALYQLKFSKTFETFERLLKQQREYRDQFKQKHEDHTQEFFGYTEPDED